MSRVQHPHKANARPVFDKQCNQVIRYSTGGDAIDAHGGEIALFNNTYYLYCTSYDCGFEWGNKNAIGWSVKRQAIHPAVKLTKGNIYCIVLSSVTSMGGYGVTYDYNNSTPPQLFGKLQGNSLVVESTRLLNFKRIVTQ